MRMVILQHLGLWYSISFIEIELVPKHALTKPDAGESIEQAFVHIIRDTSTILHLQNQWWNYRMLFKFGMCQKKQWQAYTVPLLACIAGKSSSLLSWRQYHPGGSAQTGHWRWNQPGWTHRECSSQVDQICVSPLVGIWQWGQQVLNGCAEIILFYRIC